MIKQDAIYKCFVAILLMAFLQACSSKGALTLQHNDLSHVKDGLSIITMRFKGPYVLYSITLRNLETGTRYGDLYFTYLPRENVGENQQDRQHDLFIDMPPGKYVMEHIKISHEAGFTKHTLWDGDFIFLDSTAGSPAYLGELYISVGEEVRRTGLISKVSDVYFATSSDHEVNIKRLKNRYKALASMEVYTGRIWNE